MKSLPIDRSIAPIRRQLALAWSATDRVPAMFKVAFATSDRVSVNQHFGASAGFAIYAVDGERSRLVEVAEYPAESMDGNENKLAERISTLADCAAVYCLAVGGSAVRQLLASGVQPVRLESACAIDALLLELRRAICVGGVAWVDQRVKREAPASRFDRMAEEGWHE